MGRRSALGGGWSAGSPAGRRSGAETVTALVERLNLLARYADDPSCYDHLPGRVHLALCHDREVESRAPTRYLQSGGAGLAEHHSCLASRE
jgi:hypothetical protein